MSAENKPIIDKREQNLIILKLSILKYLEEL